MLRLTLHRNLAAAMLLLASLSCESALAQQGKRTATVTYKHEVAVKNPDQTVLPDGRVIYNVTDQMPQFAGDLQSFLVANLHYPEAARKAKVEGRSVVRFIVNEAGKVSDATITRSSGNELLDQEALRVVSLMQEWRPGVKDGNPVPVFFHLPVSYRLD